MVFLCNLQAVNNENSYHGTNIENLSNFNYEVKLNLRENQKFFGALSGSIIGSEVEGSIRLLRVFTEADKTVSNMMALRDRIKEDIFVINKKMHEFGFYEADVSYEIAISGKKSVLVTIDVNCGKKFKLKANVNYSNMDKAFHDKYVADLNVENYSSSISDIKALIKQAIYNLQKNGYYDPEIKEKRIRLDYGAQEAVLILVIDPKQCGRFFFTEIRAFPGISEEFIKNRIEWANGEKYDIEKIEATENNLRNTQIFSKIHIERIKDKIEDDKIPMLVNLKEAKKHTIDFSLLYSTMNSASYGSKSSSERFRSVIARASWTRENAFGGGEKLCCKIEGTPTKVGKKRSNYALETELIQPDVFMKNIYGEYTFLRKQEVTNVFFKRYDKISLLFNYQIAPFSSILIGSYVEKNYIDGCELFFHKDSTKNRKYRNLSIPAEITLDKTDDALNPTKGYKASAGLCHTQFNNALIKNIQSVKCNFSYNYSFLNLKKTMLAFNMTYRALLGKSIDDVPIDKRIYAGGMGSVRGYGYQMASEKVLDQDTHMGGKSSIEFNAEIRRKFSQSIGGVIFVDGAKIFNNLSKNPKLQTEKKRWFFSVGFGMRYFSSVGPIRVDLAFPIKKRKNFDSKMQLIISLGEAF
jgi:translocation and assembly module TamA